MQGPKAPSLLMVIPSNVISLSGFCSTAKGKLFHCWNHDFSFISWFLIHVWILVNIEQIHFLDTVIFVRSTLTFFQSRVQDSYHPWDGVCCDNCDKVFVFTFYSKEIINDKSFCDKHRSTRVNWLIYVHIFFMSAETSLCKLCACSSACTQVVKSC